MQIEGSPVEIEWDAETQSVILMIVAIKILDDRNKPMLKKDILNECRDCPFVLNCTNNIETSLTPLIMVQLSPEDFCLLKGNNSICGIVNPTTTQQAEEII